MSPPILFIRCPLCRAINIVAPGLPPGTGKDFRNRCQAPPLSGAPGHNSAYPHYRSPLSWWPPARGKGLCGEPLTSGQGAIIPSINGKLFRAITRAPFDIAELRRHMHSSARL